MADSHRRRGARHGDLESCTLCYDTKDRDVVAAEDGDDDDDVVVVVAFNAQVAKLCVAR